MELTADKEAGVVGAFVKQVDNVTHDDLDGALLVRLLVLGLELQDAVEVDVEGDLELGHPALDLVGVDVRVVLVVLRRGEALALAHGERVVAVDELGHHSFSRSGMLIGES